MSGENVRAKTPQKPDSRLRAAAALLALCAVLVLFLALVQALIGDRVRAGEEERWNEQLRAVMPGAESFSEIWFDHARADSMLAAFDGGSPRELAQAVLDTSTQQVGAAADDRTVLALKLTKRA